MGTKSVWFVLGGVVLWGQSLRLERSDSRTEFVTAGERFCVVVRAWDATLYGAGCRLRYTPASLVKFAGWSTVNFARSELFVV
ncbi:MAG: hypothetical protein NZ949_05385, partial [Candidatus Kapabacteria bacterium]|nr:hypothetical protein [Candidatus Kapabacteria bacterium]MDW7997559.1 hypothetical protein [Bacteroidota bacterium]